MNVYKVIWPQLKNKMDDIFIKKNVQTNLFALGFSSLLDWGEFDSKTYYLVMRKLGPSLRDIV